MYAPCSYNSVLPTLVVLCVYTTDWLYKSLGDLGLRWVVTVLCENFAVEEIRHLTICDKVMREKGEVNLNFALC